MATKLIRQLQGLEELAQLERILRGTATGPIEQFIKSIAPQHPLPKHLRPVVEAVQRARFEKLRLCISIPPGHAKTLTLLRCLVWWLVNSPRDTCGYFTYNDDFGCDGSIKCRDIARGAGLAIGTPNTASQWRTPRGGGLFAGGVGTALTGRRITGLMVVDDPFKDRKTANSAVYRQDVWDWFNSVVMTRLEDASCIVVHTRWHPDDLIGRLQALEGDDWEIINLPAIWDGIDHDGKVAVDVMGRQIGEALWPEMYPATGLLDLKRQIGEYDFASLYQGMPRPRGAAVFGPPHYYNPATDKMVGGYKAAIGADPAASASTKADYSVASGIYMQGAKLDQRTWIRNVVRQQTTVPAFTRTLRAFQLGFHLAPVFVESVGGFKSVKQILQEMDPTLAVYEAPTLGDKFQRALPLAAAWNDGRVLVPENAPWLKEFLHEFEQFTGVGDLHDDQVDACAHAFNAISGGPPPVVRRSVADPSRYHS